MDHLLGVGAEENLGEDFVLLGVDDHEVGIDLVGIGQHGVAIVVVGADGGGGGDAFATQVVGGLVDVGVELGLLLGQGGESEDMDLGAEDFGDGGGGGHFLPAVDVDADGDHNAFQAAAEVESLADGEHRHGGFLDDAHRGASHPVFLEAAGSVGADDDQGGVLVLDGAGDGGGDFALHDLPDDGAVAQPGAVFVAEALEFLLGEAAHDLLLLLVDEFLFALDPYQFDAAAEAVCQLGCQIQGHKRALRKVCSYNDGLHSS